MTLQIGASYPES